MAFPRHQETTSPPTLKAQSPPLRGTIQPSFASFQDPLKSGPRVVGGGASPPQTPRFPGHPSQILHPTGPPRVLSPPPRIPSHSRIITPQFRWRNGGPKRLRCCPRSHTCELKTTPFLPRARGRCLGLDAFSLPSCSQGGAETASPKGPRQLLFFPSFPLFPRGVL